MKKKKGILGKVILAIIVLALIGAVFGSKDKEKSEAAIEPAQTAETAAEPVEAATEPAPEEPAETSAEQPVEQPAEEPAEQPATTPEGEISPELREFLESYEAFVDEYCEFLETYDSSDTAAALKALSLASKSADLSAKADDWKSQSMNDAETRYYIEVMTRIEAKLLKASQGL